MNTGQDKHAPVTPPAGGHPASPGTGAGFLQIVELRVLSGGTAVT